MEQQQDIQYFNSANHGKLPQPALPVYSPLFQNQKTDDDWDLRQFLGMLRRRALVIGSVAIAVCGTTWVWTLTQTAVYEGRIGLLVEPVTTQNQFSGLSQVSVSPSYYPGESLDYDTQVMVLRSRPILDPVIKQIATRYPDVTYIKLLENLDIERFLETKILEVKYHDSDPQKIQFVLEQLAHGFLKYSLQQRQNSLSQGIKFVDFQLPQLRGRVNSLQIQLQRFREQYNFVDPQDKATLLYQKVSNLERERLMLQASLADLRRYHASLQGKSGEALAMQAENGSLDTIAPNLLNSQISTQINSQTAQSTEFNESTPSLPSVDRPQSNNLPQTTQSEASTFQKTPSTQSSQAPARNEGSLYQRIMSQLRDLDSQIAFEATRFQNNSPQLQMLRQKRVNLLSVLQQEAKRTLGNKLVEIADRIAGLETQLAKITQAENLAKQQITKLPDTVRRYTDLLRELAIATDSLNRFLEKRQSLQVESAQKEIPWELVAAPEKPDVPVSPKILLNFVLGAIAGVLAGLGAALFLEKLDNKFHSTDELKETTKLPLLGVIPFHKNLGNNPTEGETDRTEQNHRSRRQRNAYGYNYFPFLESFRSLYTNIGFLGSDTPVHSLVISSSIHAEGKSTTATFLAQAAAAMGRRVLLVDADLRLPQIHRILKLSNDTGLSNAISTNVPVDDLIQRSPAWENLFILTAGTIPPDPTKLLSSHKMRNIMEQLRQQYDLVIYDTPPMLGLADASLLAPYTAGLAIVTRMDKTDRTMLTQTLDQLKLSRTQVLGAICNGIKDYKATTSYYHYYYQPRTQEAG